MEAASTASAAARTTGAIDRRAPVPPQDLGRQRRQSSACPPPLRGSGGSALTLIGAAALVGAWFFEFVLDI